MVVAENVRVVSVRKKKARTRKRAPAERKKFPRGGGGRRPKENRREHAR